MSTIIVQVTPDTERKLRHQAKQAGETLEAYVGRLAERAVDGACQKAQERYISDPRPTNADFEKLLGDLALGQSLPVLPADFSRADIYDDHD
jgi:hypothetical protein